MQRTGQLFKHELILTFFTTKSFQGPILLRMSGREEERGTISGYNDGNGYICSILCIQERNVKWDQNLMNANGSSAVVPVVLSKLWRYPFCYS